MIKGNDPEMDWPVLPKDATCGNCGLCVDPCGCLRKEDAVRFADFGICTAERDAPILVRRDWTAHDPKSDMPCGGDFWSADAHV